MYSCQVVSSCGLLQQQRVPKSLHLLLLDMGWRAQDCMDKPHGLDSPRAGHNKYRLDKPHGLDSPSSGHNKFRLEKPHGPRAGHHKYRLDKPHGLDSSRATNIGWTSLMGWIAPGLHRLDKPHGLDSPRAGHNKNRLDKPHGLDSPRTLDIKAQVITFKHIKYYQKC